MRGFLAILAAISIGAGLAIAQNANRAAAKSTAESISHPKPDYEVSGVVYAVQVPAGAEVQINGQIVMRAGLSEQQMRERLAFLAQIK
jgi:uncharacterized protein YdeI (BOF family)